MEDHTVPQQRLVPKAPHGTVMSPPRDDPPLQTAPYSHAVHPTDAVPFKTMFSDRPVAARPAGASTDPFASPNPRPSSSPFASPAPALPALTDAQIRAMGSSPSQPRPESISLQPHASGQWSTPPPAAVLDDDRSPALYVTTASPAEVQRSSYGSAPPPPPDDASDAQSPVHHEHRAAALAPRAHPVAFSSPPPVLNGASPQPRQPVPAPSHPTSALLSQVRGSTAHADPAAHFAVAAQPSLAAAPEMTDFSAAPSPRAFAAAGQANRDGADRVRVTVRVRDALSIDDADGVALGHGGVCEVTVPGRGVFPFAFDQCARRNPDAGTTPGQSQAQLFERVGRPLVDDAFDGFNASIIAYGATGSGKTYSVFGPAGSLGTDEEGLIPRVLKEIFHRRDVVAAKATAAAHATTPLRSTPLPGHPQPVAVPTAPREEVTVRVSAVEVYLEEAFDLLSKRRQRLPVRAGPAAADGTRGFVAQGLRWVEAHSYDDVARLIDRADAHKTYAATLIHERSSRAHTLFQIEVCVPRHGATSTKGTIVLADLAGCERIKVAGTDTGLKLEQACHINLSLLALGTCIEAVVARTKQKQPTGTLSEYRQSTLTKLLKDHLGGNSRTAILVTVSPSSRDAPNTLQALRFADRAKQLEVQAVLNTVQRAQELETIQQQYDARIAHLRRECALELERHALLQRAAKAEQRAEDAAVAVVNNAPGSLLSKRQADTDLDDIAAALVTVEETIAQEQAAGNASNGADNEAVRRLEAQVAALVSEHDEEMQRQRDAEKATERSYRETLERQAQLHGKAMTRVEAQHADEAQEMERRVASAEATAAALRGQKATDDEEIASLKAELRKSQQKASGLEASVTELTEATVRQRQDLRIITGQLAQAEQAIAAAKSETDAANAATAAAKEEGRLHAESVAAEAAAERSDLQRVMAEKVAEGQRRFDDEKRRIDSAIVTLRESHEAELSRVQSDALEASVSFRDAAQTEHETDLAVLRKANAEEVAVLKARAASDQELAVAAALADAAATAAEDTAAAVQQAASDATAAAAAKTDQRLREVESAHSAALDAEKARYDASLQEHQRNVEASADAVAAEQRRSEAAMESLRSEFAATAAEGEKCRQAQRQAEEELRSYKEALSATEAQRSEGQATIAELEAEAKRQDDLHHALAEEMASLQAFVRDQDTAHARDAAEKDAAMQRSLEDLGAELAAVKNALQVSEHHGGELDNAVHELRQSVVRLEGELAVSQDNLNAATRREQAANEQVAALAKDLNEAMSTTDHIRKADAAELAASEAVNARLDAEAKAAAKEAAEAFAQCQAAQAALTHAAKALQLRALGPDSTRAPMPLASTAVPLSRTETYGGLVDVTSPSQPRASNGTAPRYSNGELPHRAAPAPPNTTPSPSQQLQFS